MISFQQTVNNKMVEKLRGGGGGHVAAMLEFGLTPDETLDLVSSVGTTVTATTKSIWFWSHQAESADGVSAWWDWLDRKVQSQSPGQRAQTLARMFIEAVEASLPQKNGETLVATWGRALDWADEEKAPGWNRQIMMSYLASTCAKLGNPAASGLYQLERNMLVHSSDWSNAARQKYPQDPMSAAISKGQVELVDLLLDMGCSPTMQDGRPIIVEAWASFEQSYDTSELQLPNEMDSSALLFERLIERGIDWNVSIPGSKDKTVSSEAEKWLGLLKANPEKWDGVARQIEARMLSQSTPDPRPAAPRPGSKRRL